MRKDRMLLIFFLFYQVFYILVLLVRGLPLQVLEQGVVPPPACPGPVFGLVWIWSSRVKEMGAVAPHG